MIFAKFLKAPFLQNPFGWLLLVFQVITQKHWANNKNFNANIEHIFVFCDTYYSSMFMIALEAAIQNNLTKFWRFSKEMYVVEFRYSMEL